MSTSPTVRHRSALLALAERPTSPPVTTDPRDQLAQDIAAARAALALGATPEQARRVYLTTGGAR